MYRQNDYHDILDVHIYCMLQMWKNFTDGKVSFNSPQSFRGLLIPLNLKQNHDHEHKHQVSLTAMVESRVKLFEMDSRTGRY